MSQAGTFIKSGITPITPVETLTGNTGGAVGPDGANNINVIGDGTTITVAGNPGTNTLTISAIGSGVIETITGDSGGALHPTAGNFNFTGGTTGLLFSGAGSTETITGILIVPNGGTGKSSFTAFAPITGGITTTGNLQSADTGISNIGYVLTSTGGSSLPTWQVNSAAGAVLTITGNTGGPESPSAGNFNFLTSNSTVLFAGTAATETVDFNRTTNLMLGTSLPALAGGINNTGIGVSAGAALTSGNYNALVGWNAGLKLTTGSGNTVVGQLAMGNATTSSYNTALGYAALFNIVTTGGSTNAFNIGIGYQAGPNISTGIQNILIGENAGGAITTGSGNTIISNAAPNWNTASVGNVIIGGSTFALSGTGNYILNIGVIDTPTVADNAIRIGTLTGANKHTTCYIGGIDGVNVGSTAQVVTEVSGQLGSATIVGASGITVTPSANTITISNSGGGLSWSVISANQTAAVNNGYFCNKAGTLALALPAVSAVGDEITITNENTALGAQFTQGLLQQILLPNNTSTTLGATGTLTSSAIGDTITIVCKTANLVWRCTNIVGNWTPA